MGENHHYILWLTGLVATMSRLSLGAVLSTIIAVCTV